MPRDCKCGGRFVLRHYTNYFTATCDRCDVKHRQRKRKSKRPEPLSSPWGSTAPWRGINLAIQETEASRRAAELWRERLK